MISIVRVALIAPPFVLFIAVPGQLSVEAVEIGAGLSISGVDHGDGLSVSGFGAAGGLSVGAVDFGDHGSYE